MTIYKISQRRRAGRVLRTHFHRHNVVELPEDGEENRLGEEPGRFLQDYQFNCHPPTERQANSYNTREIVSIE